MGFLKKIYRWLFRSLANQLLVTYLMVITIALLAVSIWALFMIKAESVNNLRNALEVEAVNLALEIDNDLALDSAKARARIKKAVDRHAQNLKVSITVVNDEGHVLADSGARPIGENIANQIEINDALAGIVAIYERPAPNSNWLFIAYPVRSTGHTDGVIRVGMPLYDMELRLNSDLFVFLRIILATGVVTVLISLWLAKRVNRPVREMSAMARNIALSGDISEFVPVSRRDEIGELGLSFNQMIGRLREQERLRQEFIANASHELKTPTMAISSVVEALQAGAKNDPVLQTQFLDSLERLVERQSSLLQDLLDISRLDSGLDQQWQDDVQLQQILADAVEQIRPQAEKKGLELIYPGIGEAANKVIPGNILQLQRALVNILTNAVNYTPSGGSVTVTVRAIEDEERVEISVKDSGQGIEPADLPHIFERFYRADKARTRVGGGTGLGLAITREIIARHHGTIKVDSAVGRGSTFSVYLPAKSALGVGLRSESDVVY
ncbi:MAG TPA: ATP-binding protein [Oculatellaceae cyanobacterium]